ncbi:UDP-N-acetylmuramate--L-alanine ligase [unidentified eubacterium SCB49]|nr:UDP-N-acetylmuramate--L-alanine ligase [unidentified eubacterium SCB49]
MNILQDIKHIYFIGIGGIGMSALARFANLKSLHVHGYDKTDTKLTKALAHEGMQITFLDSVSEIAKLGLTALETLVIYTPAIPKTNKIFSWFLANEFQMLKRSQFLGEITKDTKCLAVAGTHGKTTTSAILGHLMIACDMPVTAFLGGIAENYNSNFISKGTEITVVEADEFDRSFLTLSPDIACITSMDADHLDIYGNAAEIEKSFNDFANLVEDKNNLLYRSGLPLEGQTVAIEEKAAFEAQNVRVENGGYVFDLQTPSVTLKDLRFYVPGHHNLHNAITAVGMAILAGASTDVLPEALASFKGVERRFSYKIRTKDIVLIDDYAHHPTELNALHQAVSEMYPEDKKVIVFQPHLFSRTKDFVTDFAQSLMQFDQVYLLDIYPARETPIEGVNSNWLLRLINAERSSELPPAKLVSKAHISEVLKTSACRIKLLVGAGDIGAEVEQVAKNLKNEG